VQWKTQALSMNFANLEGNDPCNRDTGFFVKAKMVGKRWRTDKKLAVGDTVAQLKRKYPKAKTAGSPKVFGLIFRLEPASVGGGRVPRLLANVSSKGTIRSFEVAQSNAGE